MPHFFNELIFQNEEIQKSLGEGRAQICAAISL
jgi:hypothetical protein